MPDDKKPDDKTEAPKPRNVRDIMSELAAKARELEDISCEGKHDPAKQAAFYALLAELFERELAPDRHGPPDAAPSSPPSS